MVYLQRHLQRWGHGELRPSRGIQHAGVVSREWAHPGDHGGLLMRGGCHRASVLCVCAACLLLHLQMCGCAAAVRYTACTPMQTSPRTSRRQISCWTACSHHKAAVVVGVVGRQVVLLPPAVTRCCCSWLQSWMGGSGRHLTLKQHDTSELKLVGVLQIVLALLQAAGELKVPAVATTPPTTGQPLSVWLSSHYIAYINTGLHSQVVSRIQLCAIPRITDILGCTVQRQSCCGWCWCDSSLLVVLCPSCHPP